MLPSIGDLYVHADLHGASSVIIKNPSGGCCSSNVWVNQGTEELMGGGGQRSIYRSRSNGAPGG